tara:strand:+ start:212 stop:1117 length:906 start_codon:yes stop_codon:yes gene_type:complete
MKFKEMSLKLAKYNKEKICKICSGTKISIFAHTAICSDCNVLLNFPYVEPRETYFLQRKVSQPEVNKAQKSTLAWHIESGARNHHNFTTMACFCEEYISRDKSIDVLDYGGGGGQFALVIKSLFPKSNCTIVDMNDIKLLEVYKPMNNQITFADFEDDTKKFDFIFLNDVFEHLTLPLETLELLRGKLKLNGRIFIDTPCTFWLYPLTKFISKGIHTKLLKGTVTYDHQQIWSKKSFHLICYEAGFSVLRFKRLSEYTQPPEFYLDNMGIKNTLLRLIGKIFVLLSPFISKNKIMAVIEKK